MATDLIIAEESRKKLYSANLASRPITDISSTDGNTLPTTDGVSAISVKPNVSFQQRFADMIGAQQSDKSCAGQPVTVKAALGMEVIYSAMSILVELISMTDLVLKKRTESGSEDAVDHPAYRTFKYKVNDVVHSNVWLESAMFHALSSHGSFSEINVTGTGEIRLVKLDSDRMGWGVFPVEYEDGTVVSEFRYVYTLPGTGKVRFYLAKEIHHIKGFSIDTIMGTDPIHMCADTIGFMMATRRNMTRYQLSGGAQKGYFIVPPGLDPDVMVETIRRLQEQSEELQNATGMKVAPLPDGIKWIPITNNANDGQQAELSAMEPERAARIFKIPPHMLASDSNAGFNSLDIETQRLLMFTLQPWFKRIENECGDKCLFGDEWQSGEYFFEFDRASTFKGSFKEICENARANYAAGLAGFSETRSIMGKDSKPDDWFTLPVNIQSMTFWNPSTGEQKTLGAESQSQPTIAQSQMQITPGMIQMAQATGERLCKRVAGRSRDLIKNGKFSREAFGGNLYDADLNPLFALFQRDGSGFDFEQTFLQWFPESLGPQDLGMFNHTVDSAVESTTKELIQYLENHDGSP